MKVLVVIASYGSKNNLYLNRIIDEYKGMNYHCDIVVLSDKPKQLGKEIDVSVGLPARDPWSLPFGNKKIFKEKINQYDLFIYSEDDVLMTENNIKAFLEVNKLLPGNEIPGFLRYEIGPDGKKYFSTIHSHFHWEPESVKTINGCTFAYFTNEHSGCHILTRDQLKKVIESGKYLVEPYEGFYDMLCTAATDPYSRSGLRKMICISRLDDFALHHLPNAYIGKTGVERNEVMRQLKALEQIELRQKPSYQLFDTTSRLTQPMWNKKYYDPCRYDISAFAGMTIERPLKCFIQPSNLA